LLVGLKKDVDVIPSFNFVASQGPKNHGQIYSADVGARLN